MIIAYEGDQMVGYLGVLPDMIFNDVGTALKCGWLSCMWVDPTLRGKGIAKQLLATAFRDWKDCILVTEFTPEAKGLYDRSGGFNDLCVNDGLRCYLRFNLHEVLPKKNEKYKSYISILKLGDSIANLPNSIRLSFYRSKLSGRLTFEPVVGIDESVNAYILSKQKNSFERRTAAELNWILKYPWLITSPPTSESQRYHFSSVSDRFLNLAFKIQENGQIRGYIHFTVRDSQLKVPYAYFDDECLPDIVEYIYQLMRDYQLNMLTVFHPAIVRHFEGHATPFIYKRQIKRHYIISKVLDAHFTDHNKLAIQDGDADCAFT